MIYTILIGNCNDVINDNPINKKKSVQPKQIESN